MSYSLEFEKFCSSCGEARAQARQFVYDNLSRQDLVNICETTYGVTGDTVTVWYWKEEAPA